MDLSNQLVQQGLGTEQADSAVCWLGAMLEGKGRPLPSTTPPFLADFFLADFFLLQLPAPDSSLFMVHLHSKAPTYFPPLHASQFKTWTVPCAEDCGMRMLRRDCGGWTLCVS